MGDLLLREKNKPSAYQFDFIRGVQSKMHIKLLELLESGLLEKTKCSDTVIVKEENLNQVKQAFDGIEGFKELYYLNIIRKDFKY